VRSRECVCLKDVEDAMYDSANCLTSLRDFGVTVYAPVPDRLFPALFSYTVAIPCTGIRDEPCKYKTVR
jgi:hypothetical protein